MINKSVIVYVSLLADGSSAFVDIDLAKDPFWLQSPPTGASPSEHPENFFVDRALKSLPVAIGSIGSPFSGISVTGVVLSGSVVSVTFSSAPLANATGVLGIPLLF